jgi:aspartyl/asparaginyl beta-hydroxylase (cupin superfamily)
VSNTRLVFHLPLIVPDHCGFRVGSETRPWVPGKAWVFDDTIEHEAWNDSDQLRVILIADIWNMFMTDEDRRAYSRLVEAVDGFHGGVGPAEQGSGL